MPYRITDRQPLEAELRRIGHEQIDRALAALGDTSLTAVEGLHAARKCCKKLRGLGRLVRPRLKKRTWRRLDRHFRDISRQAAGGRDAAAHILTYDRVCEHFADEIDRRGTASIRAALTRRLRACVEAFESDGRLDHLVADLEQGRAVIDTIELDRQAPANDRFEALWPGFVEAHDRARAQLRRVRAADEPEAYHEWRKDVKYHRCHLRLLRAAWPVPMTAFVAEASRLAERLGHVQDIDALDTHLRAEPDGLGDPRHVESFVGFARTLRSELERETLPLGERLLAEKGKRVARRLARWYAAG